MIDSFRLHLEQRGFRPLTVESYVRVVKAYHANQLRLTGITSNRWVVVKAALTHYAALSHDDAPLELLAQHSKPKYRMPDPPRPLDEREIETLEAAVNRYYDRRDPLWSALNLLLGTGLRVGDIGRIERRSIVASRTTNTIELEQKGGGRRYYPTDDIEEYLNALVEHEDGRWTHLWERVSKSEQGYCQKIRVTIKAIAGKAGIDNPKAIHPHLLRHTFAWKALDRIGDMEVVRQLLGQKSILSTGYYVRYPNIEAMRRAIALIHEKKGKRKGKK